MVQLVEVTLADDAPVVGQAIKDLDVPRDATFVAIIRDDHVVMARGDTVMQAGRRGVGPGHAGFGGPGPPDAHRPVSPRHHPPRPRGSRRGGPTVQSCTGHADSLVPRSARPSPSLSAALLVLLAGCGGGGDDEPKATKTSTGASIDLTAGDVTVEAAGSARHAGRRGQGRDRRDAEAVRDRRVDRSAGRQAGRRPRPDLHRRGVRLVEGPRRRGRDRRGDAEGDGQGGRQGATGARSSR